MDRDLEIHRLTARLRTLRRFGLDLCLGHIVARRRPRAGLHRPARPHRQRRSPAAARLALPRGRAVLRRDPRQPDGPGQPPPVPLDPRPDHRLLGRGVHRRRARRARAALDDQSAFIASLGSNRSARMRDVLGTIQADQDAIIRAGSRGALVVDGGPGTGKTVVALHRAAYLLYSDPRLGHRRGGVLFVGPHQPYLAYVADVLPSLGEEGVQTCTLRDLVAEGAAAAAETDPDVARLKSSARPGAGDRGGRRGSTRSRRPTAMTVDDRLVRRPAERRRLGRGVRSAGARHPAQRGARPDLGGAARDPGRQGTTATSRRRCSASRCCRTRSCVTTFNRAWPLLEAADLVGDLWSVPAYLRRCAPWLSRRRGRSAAARGRPGLDGVRPAAAGRGPAAARRPGGVPAQAPAARPPSPPSASRWTGSSTT